MTNNRVDIRRHCRVIQLLLLVFLLIQTVFFVLSWVVPVSLKGGSVVVQVAGQGLAQGAAGAMPDTQRLVGLALALPALLMMFRAAWHLDRMLRAFRQLAMFAIDTIAQMRGFAGASFLSMTLSILEPPLRALVYRYVLAVPNVKITAGVTSSELFVILVCGLFYLIAGMMQEGRRLEQENEGFI
jgi:hypothetical protein